MKIIYLMTLLAICFALPSRAQDVLMENRNSLKGVKLGDTISTVPNTDIVLINKDGNKDEVGELHYRLVSKKFETVGEDIKIDDAILTVFDGHILSISLYFKHKYGEALKAAFKAAYGDYIKPNEYVESYYWLGGVSDVSLNFDPLITNPNALFVHTTVQAMQKVYLRDRSEKAVNALKN